MKKQQSYTFVVATLCIIGFLLIAILITSEKITSFDKAVISFIQSFESSTFTQIMKFFTYIGSFFAVVLTFLFVSIVLYFVFRHRAELVLFGLVVFGTSIINQILKQLFHRDRPYFHRLVEISGYSFPSGHAMSAVAVYGMITFLLWRHIHTSIGRTVLLIISSFFILMIGASRIYLGVHYPSDIIGGYFASSFLLTVAIYSFQKYKDRLFSSKDLDAKKNR